MSTKPFISPQGEGHGGQLPPPSTDRTDGIDALSALEDPIEKRMDEIEMIGEEQAAGLPPIGHSEVTAGMRYLHCSRTIHQLVTDRNRAVGIYLAVASLLWTASTALLNVRPTEQYNYDHLMVSLRLMQRWCLPATFGTLAVLALFVAFLLIRTRVGLIYEVAKMNVLLGLPVGRVKRVNPLSIFFIMQLLISVAGGCSAGLCAGFLFHRAGFTRSHSLVASCLIGGAVTTLLIVLYVATVRYTTSDRRLQNLGG